MAAQPGEPGSWNVTSFDPIVFMFFTISFVVAAYPTYRVIAGAFHWEMGAKTPAKHFSDMLALFRYGFILFVLGNYTHTFNWITIVAFYVTIFLYGALAELPFARESLPTWRHWAIAMRLLFGGAVFIVLALAGYHIYLAIKFPNRNNLIIAPYGMFVAWYCSCLLIPLVLAVLGLLTSKVQNDRWDYQLLTLLRRTAFACHKGNDREQAGNTADSSGARPPNDTLVKWRCVHVHLHHWQIFYVLAFFTRFEDSISRIAAGAALGAYTHGVVAYGPDDFLEEDDSDH